MEFRDSFFSAQNPDQCLVEESKDPFLVDASASFPTEFFPPSPNPESTTLDLEPWFCSPLPFEGDLHEVFFGALGSISEAIPSHKDDDDEEEIDVLGIDDREQPANIGLIRLDKQVQNEKKQEKKRKFQLRKRSMRRKLVTTNKENEPGSGEMLSLLDSGFAIDETHSFL